MSPSQVSEYGLKQPICVLLHSKFMYDIPPNLFTAIKRGFAMGTPEFLLVLGVVFVLAEFVERSWKR